MVYPLDQLFSPAFCQVEHRDLLGKFYQCFQTKPMGYPLVSLSGSVQASGSSSGSARCQPRLGRWFVGAFFERVCSGHTGGRRMARGLSCRVEQQRERAERLESETVAAEAPLVRARVIALRRKKHPPYRCTWLALSRDSAAIDSQSCANLRETKNHVRWFCTVRRTVHWCIRCGCRFCLVQVTREGATAADRDV